MGIDAEGISVSTNHSVYPLVNCPIAMERSTIFNGKIHYKWPFSIAMLVHQRVNITYNYYSCVFKMLLNPTLSPLIQQRVLEHLIYR